MPKHTRDSELSPAQVQAIRDASDNGLHASEIARRFQLSTHRIYKIVRGLTYTNHPLCKEPHKVNRPGRKKDVVFWNLRTFSKEDVLELARQYYQGGKTYADLAETHDVHPATIMRYIKMASTVME
jgi:hypothetical protein